MNRLLQIIFLLCSLLTTNVQAQGNMYDVPLEERDSLWYARRDSLRALDRDTTGGNMPHVGIMGDVISGYDFTVEQAYPDSIVWDETDTINGNTNLIYTCHFCETNRHPNAFRWYHTDYFGNRVRQIVVLRTRWQNLPADIASYTESNDYPGAYSYSVEAGQHLAALTPKEYAEAKRLDMIWGECFEAAYAAGTETLPEEEKKGIIGMEIVCYNEDSVPLWKAPSLGPRQREITREVMNYLDPQTGKSYMCAAPNRTTGQADYTLEASDGKYETRWVLADEQESERWWQKYLDWIKNTAAYRYLRSWWKWV